MALGVSIRQEEILFMQCNLEIEVNRGQSANGKRRGQSVDELTRLEQ